MHQIKKIKKDIYFIGASDRRISLFENVFPIANGVSYNSYFIDDEKTVLLDTVDNAVSDIFFENLEYVLKGRNLDYVIVNHMEPDHCATLKEVVLRYPQVKIVGGQKTFGLMKQFFNFEIESKAVVVKEGDTLETGRHTLSFVMAPMVHWPEVMVTYDATDKILYSADAFGSFGAFSGNIFADEVDFEKEWLSEVRRYYTNIVGKYGTQVQALLKKANDLEIEMICPLHGLIWRKNLNILISKYQLWSTYTPEENTVLIVYGSIYGNTANAAEIIANNLADKGIKNIKMYDVSVTHPSYIVAQAFKCSHIVFACATYNSGIFCNMETLLLDLKAHNLQNRTVAIIENGSWASTSGALMKKILESMKNITLLENQVSIKSSVKEEQLQGLNMLSEKIYESIPKKEILHEEKIEQDAMFKLSYGLYVVTANQGKENNGCIINTVMQVTDSPKQIMVAINKKNYTHDMIIKTNKFNISCLTTETPFETFKHFGFQSGRDVDKFANYKECDTAENDIKYLTKYSNAVISGEVNMAIDCGTHTMFLATVTQAKVLSTVNSATYQYYFDNIKPNPQPSNAPKKGFVCKICGYVYEGDELPPDFICPLCKHGAEDFEPLQ